MSHEIILPLMIALPLFAGFFIPLAGMAGDRLGAGLAVVVSGVLLVLAVAGTGSPTAIYRMGGWMPPYGINLVGDALGWFFLLLIAAVSFIILIYSLAYMRRYTATAKYYALFMLMMAGMNGVVMSGDLFNMYVFLEIASLSSYALVAFGVEGQELEASFKYLVLGTVASSFILFSIALTYSLTGTLNLADIARTLDYTPPSPLVGFITALFLAGYGLKAALVPFHAWLPDAHPSAPAPISAMLSGLLIKALGVYCIVRLWYIVFGLERASGALITLGLLSMVVGVMLAVGQWDFKRLLAYHSISQMGYILFAFGIGSPLAIAGGLLHLLNHTFFKSLLFLCSGAVEYATGTRDLKKLGGLWQKMPFTAVSCSIASLSISAVPPMGGFFSKLIIVAAAVNAAGRLGSVAYWFAGITVFVSFMTLVSFVKVQKYVLFGEVPSELTGVREVPALMLGAMLVLAVGCVALGLFAPMVLHHFIEPARDVLLDPDTYIRQVLR